MHRNTKRLAAALLAAVLCFAAVPQAHAEPWTYEVDDVMAGYGVEFYPDVGFENPGRNTDTPQEQSSGGSVSAYGGADTGIAVFADDTSTSTGAGYTVTIPAEVNLTETETTKQMEITGTVEQYRVLTIGVTSQNNWQLNCTDNAEYHIGYTLTGFDGESENAASTDKQIVIDNGNGSAQASIDKKLTAALTAENRNDTVSGNYTDTLTFTFACEKKSTTVIIKYETMNSRKRISSGSSYERIPVYNDGTTTEEAVNASTIQKEVLMTIGETYTWSVGDYLSESEKNTGEENYWENPVVTHQATGTESKTGVGVTVIFQRKMYEFDLNVALWDEASGHYTVVQSSTELARNWGNVALTITGKTTSGKVADYYTGHVKGSSYTVSDVETNSPYKMIGYGQNINYKDIVTIKTKKDENYVMNYTGSISGTLNRTDTFNTTDGTYGYVFVWIFIEKDTTDSLLPSLDETSPVVVDVPTVDTGTDAAGSPAASAVTPKADTPEPADETPETTPEDQMLWDAGDLATLPDTLQFDDAGFGV